MDYLNFWYDLKTNFSLVILLDLIYTYMRLEYLPFVFTWNSLLTYINIYNDVFYYIFFIFQTEPLFYYCGVFFFLTTFISFFFISYLGLYGIFKFNIISLFLFWITTLIYFFIFFNNNTFYLIKLGSWFSLFSNFNVTFEFYIDNLSISYMVLTLTISYFVQLYTFSYFRYEPLVERLILFLNNFILSMIFFVSVSNLIVLFLGWELIGFTSFVLINFWVTRKATLKAAFKAFVFNKISDMFFFLFIVLNLYIFNSLDILILNKEILLYQQYTLYFFNFEINVIEILTLFLILAAFIKSAQLGFHLWLPDSMEAPVPASALIHSATLVSAGLFLLLRFNSFFELSTYSIYLIPIFGALTGLYGGLGAMFQSDIKRILAYSTISHCGFLIISFFFFSTEITLFYLYVHGFFKAGVFLCVGNVIRFSNNYQDYRRMGGFFKYLISDCYFICFGLFNLGGLPFSLGFYMKHFFLVIIQQNTIFNSLLLSICLVGALTGLFYSFKLIDYIFFDTKKAKKNTYKKFIKKNISTTYNSKVVSVINFNEKINNSFNDYIYNLSINYNFWKYGIKNRYSTSFSFFLFVKKFFYNYKSKINSFNNLNLNTIKFYFFNNSPIAIYAINYLFFFAYFIILTFLFYILTDLSIIEYSYTFNNNYNEIFFLNFISLWNLSYINWLIIILSFSIYFSFWKTLISVTQIMNFFLYINLLLFFFIVYINY